MSRPVTIVAFGLRSLYGVEGGIETHARELYSRLVRRGFRITVLTRRTHDRDKHRTIPGLSCRPLWAPRTSPWENLLHSVLSALYCLRYRPEVAHIHGIGPSALTPLLRLAGLTVVVTHHGHDYDATKWGPVSRRVLAAAESIGTAWASHVICVSHAIRRSVRQRARDRCTTIHNGAPTTVRDTLECPPRADLAAEPFVLVVGRLTAHKRPLDVLSAMATQPQLRGIHLVICGQLESRDPYVEELRRSAMNRPWVNLMGYTPPEILGWLYQHAACTVMASSYEGMPLVALETLAAGGQLLLSDIDAHREIGLPQHHYFKTGDVRHLGRQLTHLIDDATPHPDPGQYLASRFDWERIADQTANVIHNACGSPDHALGASTR